MTTFSPPRFASRLLPFVLLLGACVDAPSAPDGSGTPAAPFVVAPVFSLVGPDGSGPVAAPQATALADAFDLVDRFRLVVKRIPSGQVATDTLLSVSPGQPEYDLSVNVEINGASEQFSVTITALHGDVELFTADPITVTATPLTAPGAPAPTPANVTLRYSGPGATATSIVLAPAQSVLAPGGTVQLSAQVLDDGGQPITGVPLSWSAGAPAVASIDATGLATAAGNGTTEVAVTTPTGLQAKGWVYVVSGTLAYVQDGVVKVRAPAGGDAEDKSGGGASGPTWAGGDLYYAKDGAVYKAGSSTVLLHASWPSVSPDGGKIAGDAGGVIVIANLDGTNETEGPAGTTPQWTDWSTLVVGGGSIQTVQADGSSRSTVVSGEASLPALSSSGTLAYVSDGKLMVQGGGTPLADVGGRPAWSPGGDWIVAPGGGGLLLVPTDGVAPPVALPGTDGASDPAWQGTGVSGGTPPPLNLTGLEPDPAIPGQEVSILGSGFDWIIPKNNSVFWPGADGALDGDVLSVSATALHTVVPRGVVAGQIRVENRGGTAVLEYVPSFGSLEVHATTPWDAAVSGVGITILDSSGKEAAKGTTDEDGVFFADALLPGGYTVQISAPKGFNLDGASSRSVTIVVGATSLELTLTPSVASVTLSPERPSLGIFDEIPVTVTPYDVNGNVVPSIKTITWASATSRLDVWDGGLTTTIVGRQPSERAGDATFSVTLDGKGFGLAATVTSSIRGAITNAEDKTPVQGASVALFQGDTKKAETTTDNAGRYSFDGLLAGTYTVKPDAATSPIEATVTLNASNPRGQADFVVGGATGSGDIVVVNDWNVWDSGSNGPTLVQNLVQTAPNSGTKVVWWCGRQANPSGTALAGGICAASIAADGSGQFQQTRDNITAAGWSFAVDYQSPLTSIPADVRVFWMWTPTEQLTDAEVNVLKSFAARGGRIVFNADFKDAWYTTAQHADVETRLLTQLGTGITSIGALQYGSRILAPDHPILAGVTSVYFGAPGDMAVSGPAIALVDDGSGHVLMAWSSVDVTPLPASLAAPKFSLPRPAPLLARPAAAKARCIPGLVCTPP